MARQTGEMGAGEALVLVSALVVGGGAAIGLATDRIKFSGTDDRGEYTYVHDEEGYGVFALPMTDRTLIFSPTPFTEGDKIYVDELAEQILRERKLLEAERTKAAFEARYGVPYVPNETLSVGEAEAVVEALRPLGLVCPEGAATSLYNPEQPGAPDIKQDICIDFATAAVIDGHVSVALMPEPKGNIPNAQDLYLAFDKRSEYCVWLANTYFPMVNTEVVDAVRQLGYVASPSAEYDVAIRINQYFEDPCDSVAGDAQGIRQLDTSSGVLTRR